MLTVVDGQATAGERVGQTAQPRTWSRAGSPYDRRLRSRIAAVSPASPPPTTTTALPTGRCRRSLARKHPRAWSCRHPGQRSGRHRRLLPAAQRQPLVVDETGCGGDLVEQPAVDAGHGAGAGRAATVQQWHQPPAACVPGTVAGARRSRSAGLQPAVDVHQVAVAVELQLDIEPVQVLLRQVDATVGRDPRGCREGCWSAAARCRARRRSRRRCVWPASSRTRPGTAAPPRRPRTGSIRPARRSCRRCDRERPSRRRRSARRRHPSAPGTAWRSRRTPISTGSVLVSTLFSDVRRSASAAALTSSGRSPSPMSSTRRDSA